MSLRELFLQLLKLPNVRTLFKLLPRPHLVINSDKLMEFLRPASLNYRQSILFRTVQAVPPLLVQVFS